MILSLEKHARQRRWAFIVSGVILASTSFLVGCAPDDPRYAALRRELVLDSKPADVISIAEAKEALQSNENVSIVASISEDDFEAFADGEAAFLVTEILPQQAGHGGKDHVDNCPFCKRRAATAPRASVRFVDEKGDTLGIDARELFNLKPGDVVVVSGKGELIAEVDLLQLTATNIYLQTSETP